MTWPSNQPPLERVFLIDFSGEAEAVARLLGVFAVQGCGLAGLSLIGSAHGPRLKVEVTGLDPQRADHLRLRLQALPLVRDVTHGWRSAPQPPGAAQPSP